MPGNTAALRLHNRLLGGLITGPQLQAELADGFALGSFRALCATRAVACGLAARADTMAAIQGSALAIDALLGTGMGVGRVLEVLAGRAVPALQPLGTFAQVLADPAAWGQVLLSPAALGAVLLSPASRAALLGAPAAWGATLASAPAMQQLASTAAALQAVALDPAAWAGFKASTALTAASIPAMTSNNAPSGLASASAINGGNAAWRAFDADAAATYWTPNSTANHWVAYEFAAPVFIHTATVRAITGAVPKDVRIEYSDDGLAWLSGATGTQVNNALAQSYSVQAPGRHKYWRLFCVNVWSGVVQVSQFQLTGFAW